MGRGIKIVITPGPNQDVKIVFNFHYQMTFYNIFHIFQRKRNPKAEKNTWGKCEKEHFNKIIDLYGRYLCLSLQKAYHMIFSLTVNSKVPVLTTLVEQYQLKYFCCKFR